ncbi:unnamed protein product [Arctogadus glacialis]
MCVCGRCCPVASTGRRPAAHNLLSKLCDQSNESKDRGRRRSAGRPSCRSCCRLGIVGGAGGPGAPRSEPLDGPLGRRVGALVRPGGVALLDEREDRKANKYQTIGRSEGDAGPLGSPGTGLLSDPGHKLNMEQQCSVPDIIGYLDHAPRRLQPDRGRPSLALGGIGSGQRGPPFQSRSPMAFGHASCVWTLVLGACVALAMGTDCGKECALCVYRLLGQQPPLTSPTCSLECEGGVDSRKLRLCRELLLDEENPAPALDEEEDDEVDPDAPAGPPADPQAEAPEHQLVKKYGGFMKRYGGFMARRSPPVLMRGAPEEAGGPGRGEDGEQQQQQQQEEEEEEEENIRMEILKILNAEAEGRAAHAAEAKRYGGFMRRAGGGLQRADPLEAVLGRALKKRYGGFMRRVGRPEWLVEDAGKGGNGVLKRAWEDGRELQKRYGGFMD